MATNAPDYLIATRNNLLDFILGNKENLFRFNQFDVAARQVGLDDMAPVASYRTALVEKWEPIKRAIDAGQPVDDSFIGELFKDFARAVSGFANKVVEYQNKAIAGRRWRIMLLTDFQMGAYVDAMNLVEAAIQRDKGDKKIVSAIEIEPLFASFRAAMQQNDKNVDKAEEIRKAAQASGSGGSGSSSALRRTTDAQGMSGLTIGLIAAGSLLAAYIGYRWWKNR